MADIQNFQKEYRTLLDSLAESELPDPQKIANIRAIRMDSARLEALLVSKARKDHTEELYEVLKEIMSWYRTRTDPQMPYKLQERAIEVLYQAGQERPKQPT
jgi:hypothetical protein